MIQENINIFLNAVVMKMEDSSLSSAYKASFAGGESGLLFGSLKGNKWMSLILSCLFTCLLFLSFSIGATEKKENEAREEVTVKNECLVFVVDRSKNHGERFLKRFGLSGKKYGKIKLYSASYDLNGDGDYEYFYYVETLKFCGMKTGCYINLYEHNDNVFRELIKYGLPTFNKFDPENNHYICVGDEENNKWKNLVVNGVKNYIYNDKYYSYSKGDIQ